MTEEKNIHASVITPFAAKAFKPHIDRTAYVHPLAAVIGAAYIGRRVMISPAASVRADEGQPIWIGDESNVQDGVVLHALETWEDGEVIESNLVEHDGRKYAVYVGDRVSLAHQCQIHGPAKVGDDTFIGMQSLVFKAEIGNNCVVEPKCLLLGVTVPDGHYVPAGSVITEQFDADALPTITDDYAFKDLNKGVVHVNVHLADGYNAKT
jgi:carbonic anhydrase/acetyltransferase-like protein (isoleucine patch superfamily)